MSESSEEPVVIVASAEFVLKSSPVRRSMEQRLIDDLKFALRKAGFEDVKMKKTAGRIIINGITDTTSAATICSRVFGVAYASPATKVDCLPPVIKNTIVQTAKDVMLPGQSFAIRCHHSSPSDVSTRTIEIEGGTEVLKALHERNIRVKLNHPDRLISADLFEESAYVYTTKISGPGGLPISSQWKMLALFDSGPLSLFAAYVMMRRGCLVQLLIPPSIDNANAATNQKLELARKLRNFVTREKYNTFVMNVGPVNPPKQSIRLTGIEIARKKRFKGVIFADVDGPISPSLVLSEKSREVGLPIFQPLMGFDRQDLNELCGIFDIDWAEVDAELSQEKSALNESLLPSESLNWTLEEVSL
jgi:thiamine biosynthesis protein ThiI